MAQWSLTILCPAQFWIGWHVVSAPWSNNYDAQHSGRTQVSGTGQKSPKGKLAQWLWSTSETVKKLYKHINVKSELHVWFQNKQKNVQNKKKNQKLMGELHPPVSAGVDALSRKVAGVGMTQQLPGQNTSGGCQWQGCRVHELLSTSTPVWQYRLRLRLHFDSGVTRVTRVSTPTPRPLPYNSRLSIFQWKTKSALKITGHVAFLAPLTRTPMWRGGERPPPLFFHS